MWRPSGFPVNQDLSGGNCEAAAEISWALCRVPVRPFVDIVKGGQSAHWEAVTGDVKNQYLVAIYDLAVVTGAGRQ